MTRSKSTSIASAVSNKRQDGHRTCVWNIRARELQELEMVLLLRTHDIVLEQNVFHKELRSIHRKRERTAAEHMGSSKGTEERPCEQLSYGRRFEMSCSWVMIGGPDWPSWMIFCPNGNQGVGFIFVFCRGCQKRRQRLTALAMSHDERLFSAYA